MENAEILKKLTDAALPHVVFDGWSEVTLKAAIADSGVEPGLARALLPRGGIDLARAWHRLGDRALAERLAGEDLGALRFRDRIAHAIRLRLALSDREALRRASALNALHPADGAACLWETADTIWTALGDTSRDVNWYTKRATLAAVHGAAVLYWLGEPEDLEAFIDRRIEGVMAFEKTKARIKSSPLGRLLAGPLQILDRIAAPTRPDDLPGSLKKGA
jgi:ubiquinone biosynthesis protein COQ9